MSPNPRDDAQLGVRYTPHRVFLILWREVEVLLCGHHYGFGLDRGEGIIVVAVEVGGLTYVAILPRPEHTEEVIGVSIFQEEPLPETHEEVLQRRVPHLAIHLVPVEGLGETPPRVYACHRAQAPRRLLIVPPMVPGCVRSEGGFHSLQEHYVVAARLGRAAERQDAGDHLRVANGPLVGLTCAHRPASYQHELLDAKVLRDESVLRRDVVVYGHAREAGLVVRRRGVAGRRREPVAYHVRNDDKVLGRVEGHALPNQPLVLPVSP